MHGTASVALAEFEAGALTGDPGLQMCTGLAAAGGEVGAGAQQGARSEEHTSELQSRGHLVCRLLLEKKKKYPADHIRLKLEWCRRRYYRGTDRCWVAV